jgi:hypothetical protein
MKASPGSHLVALVLLFVGAQVASANLVTNPGFETGDFTGWTATPAGSGSFFRVDPSQPHSGTYAPYFGGFVEGSFDSISQSLATTAGGLYELSFWLRSNITNPPNEFRAFFNGVMVYDVIDAPAFPYTQIIIPNLLATGSSTTLEFEAYYVLGFFRLDDISVVQTGFVNGVPDAGSTALILGCGLVALILAHPAFGWRFA